MLIPFLSIRSSPAHLAAAPGSYTQPPTAPPVPDRGSGSSAALYHGPEFLGRHSRPALARKSRYSCGLSLPPQGLGIPPTFCRYTGAMLSGSGIRRVPLTLLLAVVVPLCCCRIHELADLALGHAHPGACPLSACCRSSSAGGGHGDHHDHAAGSAPSLDHHPKESTPARRPGPHTCSCGADQKLTSAPIKLNLHGPGPLLATLDPTAPQWCAVRPTPARWTIARASGPLQGPSTLLRLHCALIF